MKKYFGLETWYAFLGITLGLAVSAALASTASWFLPNAEFFWGSQLAILALLLPFWPRPAVVGGVAAALAIYLAAFGTWLFTRDHPESLAWVVYVLSLPGAAVGAIAIGFWHRRRETWAPLTALSVSALFVLAGVSVNQAMIWGMLMYWK